MSEKRNAMQRFNRENDLLIELRITLAESAMGCEKRFDIKRLERCPVCQGAGKKRQGSLLTAARRFLSSQGAEPCDECKGKGLVEKTRNVSIKIPAGIENDQTILMNGQGNAGLHGEPVGNLYIKVKILPHKTYLREGYNLLLVIPVDPETAKQGGEIKIPALCDPNFSIKYSIPPDTQQGAEFRINGAGIPHIKDTGSGDLIIKINITPS